MVALAHACFRGVYALAGLTRGTFHPTASWPIQGHKQINGLGCGGVGVVAVLGDKLELHRGDGLRTSCSAVYRCGHGCCGNTSHQRRRRAASGVRRVWHVFDILYCIIASPKYSTLNFRKLWASSIACCQPRTRCFASPRQPKCPPKSPACALSRDPDKCGCP